MNNNIMRRVFRANNILAFAMSVLMAASAILTVPPTQAAAISQRGAVTANNTITTANTLTFLSLPAGWRQNDVFIAVFSVYNPAATVSSISGAAGWTLIPGNTASVGNMKSFMYYKVAGAAETAPTIKFSAAQKSSGVMMAYSGVSNVAPVAGYASPKTILGSKTMTTNAISTTMPTNAMVVAAVAAYASSNTVPSFTAVNSTNPVFTMTREGLSASVRQSKSAPMPVSALEYGVLPVSGNVGSQSMLANISVIGVGYLVALNPEVATYAQSAYRFFSLNSNGTIDMPLVAQDTPATVGEQKGFSLRSLVSVNGINVAVGQKSLKLQAAPKTTVCGVYSDVPASATKATALPVSAVDDALIGSNTWQGVGNVGATDGYGAMISRAIGTTHLIKATGYGFNIPTGSQIISVQALVTNKFGTSSPIPNVTITGRPIVGGSIVGAPFTSNATQDSYGVNTLKLQGISLTAADVNDSNFGVAIYENAQDFNGQPITANLDIDSITLRVVYQQAPLSTGLYLDYANMSGYEALNAGSYTGDPTTGRPVAIQTIVNYIPFTNVNAIPQGSDGLWDLRLTTGPGSAGNTYCLRLVDGSSALLDSYQFTPEITITNPAVSLN